MKTTIQTTESNERVQIVRHAHVCQKLQISSAKLFDLIAQGIFPKPFTLIPGGRAVGWLERDVDEWILARKSAGHKNDSERIEGTT